MTTLQLGSKTWVLLNTKRVAQEIYNKRSSITNDRPWLPIISDMISDGRRSALLMDKEWSKRRRVLHQLLSGTALKSYANIQVEESSQLLNDYLECPEEWYLHNGRYSNSVICRIGLGQRVDKPSDKLTAIFQVAMEFISNSPPFNCIDCFPQLTRLPRFLQWWRKSAEILRESTLSTFHAYWDPIARSIKEGNSTPSFARDVLMSDNMFDGDETDRMYLAIQLIEAGSDTTRSSINLFAMAAVLFPETFLKARAEVDQVCGGQAQRLPLMEDETRMPYVLALIKEIQRWRPILVWNPEHVLTQDLEFEGYFFPKGTCFVLNQQAIHSNPQHTADPDTVKPERFLDGNEMDILKDLYTFGGGRRVCVGYRLAQRSLFITYARMLYCFDFEAVGPVSHIRKNDHETHTTQAGPIDSRNPNHFAVGKEPFPVKIQVRGDAWASLIKEDVKQYAFFDAS